jgi:hypothetical protein
LIPRKGGPGITGSSLKPRTARRLVTASYTSMMIASLPPAIRFVQTHAVVSFGLTQQAVSTPRGPVPTVCLAFEQIHSNRSSRRGRRHRSVRHDIVGRQLADRWGGEENPAGYCRCSRLSLGEGADSGTRGATGVPAQLRRQSGNRRREIDPPRANRRLRRSRKDPQMGPYLRKRALHMPVAAALASSNVTLTFGAK